MKHRYTFALLLVILLSAFTVEAQYVITSQLLPYQQDFNAMGTGSTTFTNGSNAATLPGIISGYNYGGTFAGLPSPIYANDGSATASAAYNFGTTGAADRALGGIAGGLSGNSGTGYICVRLRNSSGVMIKNLDVRYAIEQWYNSSLASEAYFRASYRVYANTTSFANNDLVQNTGANGWTAVPELDLQAPATGGALGQADGNSTTYRRTAQHRLTNLNLANNSEVVIRFAYVFSSATNGNGISLDDLAIYPETNVLYSTTSGNLNSTANWGQNLDGTNPPASGVDFAAANYTYYVRGTTSASRLSGRWAVSGANSRVIVGTDAAPASLYLGTSDNMAATVDVAKGSTLTIANSLATTSTGLKLGVLAAGSTVEYTGAGTSTSLSKSGQNVLPATYSSLVLGGSGPKNLTGDVTVASALTLAQAAQLNDYNLTMLRGATLASSSGGQIVTNGTGEYRATVIGAGSSSAAVLFPVASAVGAANYLPVAITAGSSDKDDTYRVRVIDNSYTKYLTSGIFPNVLYLPGLALLSSKSNVNATWFISHETTTPVAATLQMGWATSKEGASFVRANAYVDHYTTASNTWDALIGNVGSAVASTGQWAAQRTGVSNFSPFTVASYAARPLPVVLTAFAAQRTGSSVACAWTTASEQGNAYFEVERSLDGTTFQTIGKVVGQGTSAVAHAYAFTDAQPAASRAYYRLRQVDTDGQTTFSPVVAVAAAASTAATITAVPNPSAGYVELQTVFQVAGQVQAVVLNALGQQVLTVARVVQAGAGSLPLDLSAQPAGMYVVQLYSPAGVAALRVLKQ